jgi:hypothetical protein
MTEFEKLFEIQALNKFDIGYIEDYIQPLDIDRFLLNVDRCTDEWTQKDNWRKAIEALVDNLNKIYLMIENPELLSIDDRQVIRKMQSYLYHNSGKDAGYYAYRKKLTNELIQEYCDMVIQNRMVLLTNIDAIEKCHKDLIQFYQMKLTNKVKIAFENYNEDKLEWGKRHYKCTCGVIVQQKSKAQHERSKKHITFINPDSTSYSNDWVKLTYICGCGRAVGYTNKHHHNKTEFHRNWKQSSS